MPTPNPSTPKHPDVDPLAALDPLTPPAGAGSASPLDPLLRAWQAVQDFDARRERLPNETALTWAAGGLLLVSALRSRSFTSRVLQAALAGALLGRAAKEQKGLDKAARLIGRLGGAPTRR